MRTPLGLLTQGNVSGAIDELGAAAQGRVQAMMNPESALQTGFDFMGGGLLGQTAYHGSPYLFNKFNANKIGTGEGAQVYGHGMYFAENPKVAEEYRNALKFDNDLKITTNGDVLTQKALTMSNMDKDKAISMLKSGQVDNVKMPESFANYMVENTFAKMQNPSGTLYKVDIPDVQIPKMLEWDKPLSSQSQEVKNVAANLAKSTESWKNYSSQLNEKAYKLADEMIHGKKPIVGKESAQYWKKLDKLQPNVDHNAIFNSFYEAGLRSGQNDVSGSQLYNLLSRKSGTKEASDWLLSQGIPGIKYLDQGSRISNEGTRNFVVFDPTDVKILERK